MPRRKKTDDPIGVGLTAKQMRRKKPINTDLLVDIEPLTDNQEKFFADYKAGKNLFAYGCAGTGKTFIALYNALRGFSLVRHPTRRFTSSDPLWRPERLVSLPGDHEG